MRRVYSRSMAMLLIFIPTGETEPITIRIEHAANLSVPGFFHTLSNTAFLGTELWNSFRGGNQLLQKKIFDQLIRINGVELPVGTR